MANEEHLEILKQGVKVWNEWRDRNRFFWHGIPDLEESNLEGLNLEGADLSSAHFDAANLTGANLTGAKLKLANFKGASLKGANLSATDLTKTSNLKKADLRGVNFSRANLSQVDLFDANLSNAILEDAELWHTELRNANFQGANLSGADLRGANLNIANFREANLSNAILLTTQALATDFSNAIFTGACLEDWHINSSTRLDQVICDYVYQKFDPYPNHSERRPHSRDFKTGEFTKLYQKALETIDIVFLDGIEWKTFLVSFLDLKAKFGNDEISIQSFENRNGAFIVRINVPAVADKAEIERVVEEKYQLILKAKDSHIMSLEKIVLLREAVQHQENTNLLGIIKIMAEKETSKKEYTFNGDVGSVENQGNIASSGNPNNIGNAAGEAQAEMKSIQHNYAPEQKQTLAEAAAEIQKLIQQLEETNPTATVAEKQSALAIEIQQEIKRNPNFKVRLRNALKEGGIEALKVLFAPIGIPIEMARGWIEAEVE